MNAKEQESHQEGSAAAGPPRLDFGGIGSSAWREEALTRLLELRGLADWIELKASDSESELADTIGKQIGDQLEWARKTAEQQKDRDSGLKRLSRFKRWLGGADFERTLGRIDAVEADLLRLAPNDYVCGLMPSLKAHVNRFLPKDDPRRLRLGPLADKAERRALTSTERGAAVAALHAANTQRRRELLRVRTFRNILVAATLVLFVVALGLAILGAFQPTLMPICFTPDNKVVVCPTGSQALLLQTNAPTAESTAEINHAIDKTVSGWDIGLVELIGLVAAAVAAAFAIRRIRGTSTPYSLPVSLAALKLATGALTAFLGLMLMRGGFVPGLSALDTSAQILAWAIIFGYSQQLFTRLVDQQAQNVLEGVGGHGAGGDRPLPQGASPA
jgi:hypothetical protein